jgi:hypothetical protein
MVENHTQLSPNCPDQAGLVIHQMAIEVLSPSSPKSAINLLVAHLQLKGMCVDRSRVSAWCNGHFIGNRQMTTEQFQELVNVFWQQPGGIENIAGILALANCIGKLSSADLAQSLDYDWLVSLGYKHSVPFENIHTPDPRYPDDPFTLPRQNMLAKLTGMLSYASVSNCPIVIFGQPGTGKSRLLSQLAYSSWGEPFEKKRLIYLNGGGLEAYLRAWHLEIYGFQAPASMRAEDLTATLRLQEKTNRQIVLIDSVAHVSFIRPILKIFKDTGRSLYWRPIKG